MIIADIAIIRYVITYICLDFDKTGNYFYPSFETNATPMTTTKTTINNAREIPVWQLTAKIIVLAGVLMAYSYCFLLTVNSVLKLAH